MPLNSSANNVPIGYPSWLIFGTISFGESSVPDIGKQLSEVGPVIITLII